MDAKQKLIEYASKRNNTSMTNEEFIGKAFAEGVVFERTSNSTTSTKIVRQGRTIIINEVTRTQTSVETPRGITRGEDKITTVEIERIEL